MAKDPKSAYSLFTFFVQDDVGPGSDDDEHRRPAVLDLQRLVYICRACLRLIVTFTEEVYPGRIAPGSSKPVPVNILSSF